MNLILNRDISLCDRLNSLAPAPDLPRHNNYQQSNTERIVSYCQELDLASWLKLKQRGGELGITPNNILLAIYAEILACWSKNSSFTLSVVTSDRSQTAEPSINLLALNYSQPQSFLERGKRVQAQLQQNTIDELDTSDRFFAQTDQAQTEKINSILGYSFISNCQQESVLSSSNKICLRLEYTESKSNLEIKFSARENLFPPKMVEDMQTAYCDFITRLSQSETAWSETTRQLIPSYQLQHRATINNTDAPLPETNLYSLFTESANQQPQAIALVTPQKTLTYQQLLSSASQIGSHLQTLGISPQTPVGIVMEKGWEQIAAVLGILAIGAVYIPIDPALPAERLSYLIENSGSKIVLTQSWLQKRLSLPESIQIVACVQEDLSSEEDSLLVSPARPDDLAYIIYTSGSTGLPKGVMITHRNVVNVVIHTNKRFEVSSEDKILALTALNHDLSVYDIFGTLAAGGTIVMPSAAAAKFPRHWLDLIIKEKVTLWNSVPAMMEMLVNYLEILSQQLPSTLRLSILGGDWLPVSLVKRLQILAPSLQILSIGGPTETTIWNIGHLISELEPNAKSVPYGQPMANSQYYILREDLTDCPVWVAGEMYCAGVQVALGYWRNSEKTAANFIIHPRTGERIYRTGDLGRYLPDGDIEFLGRADFQIKLRGHRIEAGEIESILLQYPTICNAVITVEGKQHQPYLVAHIVTKTKHNLNNQKLQSFLSDKLPAYMVPSRFTFLDALPLTANGKVDRRTLAKIASLK